MVSAVSYNKKLWRVLRQRSLLEADNVLVFLFWPTYLFWLVVSWEGVSISDWWRLWCSLCRLINLLWPFGKATLRWSEGTSEVTEVILYTAGDKSTWLCVCVCVHWSFSLIIWEFCGVIVWIWNLIVIYCSRFLHHSTCNQASIFN